MGHACEILEFDAKMSREEIQKACDRWGDLNCDPYERGYPDNPHLGGLCRNVKFTSKVFADFDSASEYLERTFGNYDQTAVQFKRDGALFWAVTCEVHC